MRGHESADITYQRVLHRRFLRHCRLLCQVRVHACLKRQKTATGGVSRKPPQAHKSTESSYLPGPSQEALSPLLGAERSVLCSQCPHVQSRAVEQKLGREQSARAVLEERHSSTRTHTTSVTNRSRMFSAFIIRVAYMWCRLFCWWRRRGVRFVKRRRHFDFSRALHASEVLHVLPKNTQKSPS